MKTSNILKRDNVFFLVLVQHKVLIPCNLSTFIANSKSFAFGEIKRKQGFRFKLFSSSFTPAYDNYKNFLLVWTERSLKTSNAKLCLLQA